MATLRWPLELPQRVLLDGYSEQAPNTALRSQTETGPAIARNRVSAGVRPITAAFDLLDWQVHRLDRFYLEEVKGTLPFRFPRPRMDGRSLLLRNGRDDILTKSGVLILVSASLWLRFVEPPTYTAPYDSAAVWHASLSLEAMP
jgi:hypothetical protein